MPPTKQSARAQSPTSPSPPVDVVLGHRAAQVFDNLPFTPGAKQTATLHMGDSPLVICGPMASCTISGIWLAAHCRRLATDFGTTIIVGSNTTSMRREAAFLQGEGVSSVYVNPFATASVKSSVATQVKEGRPTIAYIPVDVIAAPQFRTLVANGKVGRIVVTDAEQMSRRASSFRPSYASLPGLKDTFCGAPLTLVFARAPLSVVGQVSHAFDLNGAEQFVVDESLLENVELRKVASGKEKEEALVALVDGHKAASVIIYVRDAVEAVAVSRRLSGIAGEVGVVVKDGEGEPNEATLARYLRGEFHILVTDTPVENHLARRPPEIAVLTSMGGSHEALMDRVAYTAAQGEGRTIILQCPADIPAERRGFEHYPTAIIGEALLHRLNERQGAPIDAKKFTQTLSTDIGFGVPEVAATLDRLVEIGAVGESSGRVFSWPVHVDSTLEAPTLTVAISRAHRRREDDLAGIVGLKSTAKGRIKFVQAAVSLDEGGGTSAGEVDSLIPLQTKRLKFVLQKLSKQVYEFDTLIDVVLGENPLDRTNIFQREHVRAELADYCSRGFIRIIAIPGKCLVTLDHSGVDALRERTNKCPPSKTFADFCKRGLCPSNQDTVATAIRERLKLVLLQKKDWEALPAIFLRHSYRFLDLGRHISGAEVAIACFQLEQNISKVSGAHAKRLLRIVMPRTWFPEGHFQVEIASSNS